MYTKHISLPAESVSIKILLFSVAAGAMPGDMGP